MEVSRNKIGNTENKYIINRIDNCYSQYNLISFEYTTLLTKNNRLSLVFNLNNFTCSVMCYLDFVKKNHKKMPRSLMYIFSLCDIYLYTKCAKKLYKYMIFDSIKGKYMYKPGDEILNFQKSLNNNFDGNIKK